MGKHTATHGSEGCTYLGNSYSHAQWYHTACRTETTARRNKRFQEAILQAGWNISGRVQKKKKIHLQWFSPAHCLVILLSGLSHIGQASELQLATWAKVVCLWAAGGWISNCQVSFCTDCGIISKLPSASSFFLRPWRASLHSALGATAQEYFINRPEGLSATCPISFRSPEISWAGMSAHIILLCCLDARWKITYWGRRCLLTHGLGLPA